MHIACWIRKATNTHTLRICNTYCFSTAIMIAQRRPNVTLYLHCLSCLSSPRSFALSFSSICSYVIYRGPRTLKLLVYFLFQTFACYQVGVTDSIESQAFTYRASQNSSFGSKVFPGGQTRGHDVPQTLLVYKIREIGYKVIFIAFYL